MGTATLDTRATSPKPISASPTGKEADELDHNVYYKYTVRSVKFGVINQSKKKFSMGLMI